MYHPVTIYWPDPREYDFYTDEYATTPYTEEFTPEDEREWNMNNSGYVKLSKQDENNRRWIGSASISVSECDGAATISLVPGGAQTPASAVLTKAELGQLADRIDKVLGRKPRKEEVSVKVDGDKLTITGLFDVAAPF